MHVFNFIYFRLWFITNLSDWSTKWNLLFNASKCILMQFHRSNHSVLDYSYKLGEQSISSKTTHKDLGLILHNNLNCMDKSLRPCTYAQRHTVSWVCLSEHFHLHQHVSLSEKEIFISLVRSQLSYCSQIWRPALIKDIRKLERVQRRATKFIVGNTLDYRNRLIKLEIMPLMYYLEMADIMFLVNSLKQPSACAIQHS